MDDINRNAANRQLELLRTLSVDLAQAADIDAVLWTIARSTMRTLGYEDCVIYVVDTQQRILTQRAAHGPKCPEGEEIVDPIVLRFGEGIVGACAESAQPVRVVDTAADDRYVVDDQARGSELAVPVIDNGEVIAIIDSEHSAPGFYSDADELALCDIAAIAAARLRAAITVEALHDSVSQLESARRELDSLARTDHLTGLLNRRGFEEMIAEYDALGENVCIAVLDVDRFKAINDTHGHLCGDDVLRKIAHILAVNSVGSQFVASRLGGDEFAVLGPDLSALTRVALAVLGDVRSHDWEYGSARLDVSVSIGSACTAGCDVWGLADEALFLAKSQGRDQFVVYDAEDPSLIELQSDRRWAATVKEAMEADDLILFAQPIVDCQRPNVGAEYFEMLLRYRAPGGELMSPGLLLGAAERFGLSEQLDLWVVRKVVEWLAAQPAHVRATVNVTAYFVDSPRALSMLGQMLTELRVQPSRLCIEITETTAIADMDRCRDFVRTAHRWGCKIAIDDFGSGWTALPLVRDFEVDVLKIDGSWVKDVTRDKLASSVVTAIMEASKIIGVDVVAEWVEDEETITFLQGLGVDYLQGFYTGKPRPLDEVTTERTLTRSANTTG